MRYLVTGGAGFIGSSVVEELLHRGHNVVVLDDLSTGKEENLATVRSKIDFRVGNVTHLADVESACHGVDYVIHLAARMSVVKSVQDPLETNHVNVDGTLKTLIAARDAKVRRLIFAASCSVYPEAAAQASTEAMLPEPITPYGVTKYVGELYTRVFGHAYGLENACIRYFNVFGPRQDPSSRYSGVLSRFMLAILKGEPPVVYGDGEQSRDFVYIADVVKEMLLACEAHDTSGKVFNGASGVRITLNEVLRKLETITGQKIQARYEPSRTGDIRDSWADISLARKVLGYEPSVSLEEGLRRTWEWYKLAYGKK